MSKVVSARPRGEIATRPSDGGEPNPLWALAVGLVYVFRTAPGRELLRELERTVRAYAADPRALWRLVRGDDESIVDSTAREQRELPTGGE